MNQQSEKDLRQIILLILLAASTALAFFYWEGRQGFSLWDEGYLWYGVQRVMLGEVPIRDFMAYDPGRYYWSSSLMLLAGDNGIMALRATEAMFQVLGLYIGLSVLARSCAKSDILFLLLAAITLSIWMSERHRIFDSTLPIALIGVLAYLIQQPCSRRYFLTGFSVGLVAFFGRNHGMYGVSGSLAVIGYLAIRREQGPPPVKALLIWASGVVVGYLPLLLMLAFVQGFGIAFWNSIRYLFEIKATNIPLPIPWPWRVEFSQMILEDAVRGVMTGIFFLAIVAFGLLGIAWVIRQRLQGKAVNPALVASVSLALPYAHYAYSRADVYHLQDGIFSLIMGCFLMLVNRPAKVKWPLAGLLCGASLLVMLPFHPGWQCYTMFRCVETNFSGDMLKVDPSTANDIEMLRKLAGEFAPGDRSFIATPFWPGAYAVLERKSPMWEIYPLLPHSPDFEQAEIERVKAANPGFAMVIDIALDNRDELRFKNTHPLFYQYLLDNFDLLDAYTKNPAYQVYKSRVKVNPAQ
jgi:hypothetical protein